MSTPPLAARKAPRPSRAGGPTSCGGARDQCGSSDRPEQHKLHPPTMSYSPRHRNDANRQRPAGTAVGRRAGHRRAALAVALRRPWRGCRVRHAQTPPRQGHPRQVPRMALLASAARWLCVTDVGGNARLRGVRRLRSSGDWRDPSRPPPSWPESSADSPIATPTAFAAGMCSFVASRTSAGLARRLRHGPNRAARQRGAGHGRADQIRTRPKRRPARPLGGGSHLLGVVPPHLR
jgi:hypothetical protein